MASNGKALLREGEARTLQERMDEAVGQYNVLSENMARLQASFNEMEVQRQQLAGQMNLLRDLMAGDRGSA